LLVVAGAQLMLVLDDLIASIALPSIQNELAVSSASLPWVINAYVLSVWPTRSYCPRPSPGWSL
jgi:hypothetical protein